MNNAVQTVRAGKALGGSTTINGLAWSKPHTFQIDAMQTVGNAGLNWASLETYVSDKVLFKWVSPDCGTDASRGEL